METKNAIITSATLDIGDRGFLQAWLYLEYGGSGQGFGGYVLYLPKDFAHHKGQINYAGHFIYRRLQIAGVEKWEQLNGKTIRVKCEHSKVHAIGHIINEDWFNPSEDFDAMRTQAETSFPVNNH
jgi:hypothetical protein